MRIAERLEVPWSAYTVAFSGDGERLAIGGGSWYGQGGVRIMDLANRTHHDTPFGGNAVSGLHWSRNDRHLFASAWGPSQRSSPALALQVDGLVPTDIARLGVGGMGAPTGIVTLGTSAATRISRGDHRSALVVKQWADDLGLDSAPPVQQLTGNRLVIAHDRAVTGNHLVTLDRGTPIRAGLLVRQLGDSVTAHLVAPELGRITAIGVTADGDLITGTEIGELDLWTWNASGPAPARRLGVIPLPVVVPDARWITYRPTSVVGICCLHDGSIAAVTAGGTLAIARADQRLAVWQLPVPGSPRSIAAHPDRAMVAIGLKNGGFAAPESPVAIAEVEPETIDPAWRTERITAIARETVHTPTAFSVLADALEEIGAAARVLAHLRTHDPRCKRCWVIDQLATG